MTRHLLAYISLAAVTTSLLVALPAARNAETGAPSLQISLNDTAASIACGGKELLRYRSGNVPFKPYVDIFRTPSGINVLRDSPHDHIHHHALMFAIAADGVDFWIEFPRNKPGTEAQRDVQCSTRSVTFGDLQARAASITGTLDWLSADRKPILTEKRSVEAYCAASLGASLLTWRTRLEPAAGKSSVKLSGSHYFGLGMRFVESMDKGGRFVSSTGEPGTVVRGTERLVRASWCAYTAAAGGHKVTVAIFDHPDNPRHPATMFTMTEPFAYLAATLNLWKEPMTLAAEKPLALCYGVALWDGEVGRETIDALWKKWRSIPPPTKGNSP